MKKEKKIQDFDLLYVFLKPCVNITFSQFYDKIIVDGKKNIPKDKTIILAPNHQNALMDALAILMTQPGQPVFLARADIFKKKSIASILHTLNILPVYRQRDGRGELDKNKEIFEQAVDVLRDNVRLCLMPEGVQSSKRSLLPLVKGMFRIAFFAQEELPDRDIVIVPTGIDYEDYVTPGENLIIRFGAPISVKDYMPLYETHQAKALNALREDLSERIGALIQNIRSEKHYDAFYGISLIADASVCGCKPNSKKKLLAGLEARQKISRALDKEEQNNPEAAEKLAQQYTDYSERLEKSRLTDAVFEKSRKIPLTLLKSLLLILAFPFFLAGAITNFIPSFFSRLIPKRLKKNDFKSSFHVVLWLVLYVVYYLIGFIVLCFVCHSILTALAIAFGSMFLGRISLFYQKWTKNVLEIWRFISLRGRKPAEAEALKAERDGIIETVLKLVGK